MKNILKNNKGFTLLEILVTVGIVGVLSAVAVPAYNQYKRGTIETAIESDVGNFQKAYMAYNAVNGSYCANFQSVGIRVRDGRNYAKNGAIGFQELNAACGTSIPVAEIQYKPTADIGTCSVAAHTDRAACENASATWTSATQGDIAVCELDIDQFQMGATTNVSGINKVWGINEEGKIKDKSFTGNSTGKVTCPGLSVNWDTDPNDMAN